MCFWELDIRGSGEEDEEAKIDPIVLDRKVLQTGVGMGGRIICSKYCIRERF